MPIEIIMPKLGLTMTEGTVVEWKKKEGDPVKKGDILFVLQTEKVTFEVESPEDGLLGKILVREKGTAPVGGVVAYLLKPGESEMDIRAVSPVKDEAPPLEGEAVEPAPAERGEVAPGEPARVKASPLAKKMAKEYNLDLGRIKGTGPGGRITKEDVEKAYEERQRPSVAVSEPKKEEPVETLVPFTGMRRTIAKRMLSAKVETAQTYISNTVDATRIMEYRESLLPYIQEKYGVRVTITDIMMKIAGAAIREHPIINTRWTEEGILYLEDVHMGMAMALDDGLIVPVIRDINKKGFALIAMDRMALIRKGKEKAFLPDDITGSTFTLSSMGMFGVEHFTANINLPENGILGVAAVIDKPVVLNGEVVVRPMMNVTLTYDHRTIDGAEAGKFMRTLKRFIENPVLIFA